MEQCRHKVSMEHRCIPCGRQAIRFEVIKRRDLAKILDDLADELRQEPEQDEDPVYHYIELRIADKIAKIRTRNYGERK